MEKSLDMADLFDVTSARSIDEYEMYGIHDPYPPVSRAWLWFDPIVNIWCCTTCALCLVPLFSIAQDGPKDIVYDAFALLFLVNLDDVGGDLAFLNDKWNAERFGQIFGELCTNTISTDDAYDMFHAASDEDTSASLIEKIRGDRKRRWFSPVNLYTCGTAFFV